MPLLLKTWCTNYVSPTHVVWRSTGSSSASTCHPHHLCCLQCLLATFLQESRAIAKMTARCALFIAYMGALKIFGSPCMATRPTPTANFPDIFNGLLFRSIPWLCVQNLKFVPLPTPEVGLIVIDWSGGGFKAQSSGREGRRGSGMEPFEKALMSSYRQ